MQVSCSLYFLKHTPLTPHTLPCLPACLLPCTAATARRDADAAAPQQMVRPLQQFDLAELDAARALLAEETQGVVAAMGHDGVAAEEYFEAWRATADEWVLDGKVRL